MLVELVLGDIPPKRTFEFRGKNEVTGLLIHLETLKIEKASDICGCSFSLLILYLSMHMRFLEYNIVLYAVPKRRRAIFIILPGAQVIFFPMPQLASSINATRVFNCWNNIPPPPKAQPAFRSAAFSATLPTPPTVQPANEIASLPMISARAIFKSAAFSERLSVRPSESSLAG
ncbi:hypothetical protein BYT27DRAFT_6849387 [Phlegmacium glaucopus]|nr:hypothetical protein BYT27DRAFT_6849387 [Phlegmacium glaucopus]